MFSPFDIWSPIIRAPFSGDVTQEIVPRLFSPDIKGSPEIEGRVVAEVASYGKQLGKLLEAVQELAQRTGEPLPEIETLIEQITEIKNDSRDVLKAEAEAALARLKAADPAAWEVVRSAD